jgi:hypothetical protein
VQSLQNRTHHRFRWCIHILPLHYITLHYIYILPYLACNCGCLLQVLGRLRPPLPGDGRNPPLARENSFGDEPAPETPAMGDKADSDDGGDSNGLGDEIRGRHRASLDLDGVAEITDIDATGTLGGGEEAKAGQARLPVELRCIAQAPASITALPQLNSIIKACWQQRALRRPTAADLHAALHELTRQVQALQ